MAGTAEHRGMMTVAQQTAGERDFSKKYLADERLEEEASARGESALHIAGMLGAQILLRTTPTDTKIDSYDDSPQLQADFKSDKVEIDGATFSLSGYLRSAETDIGNVTPNHIREGYVHLITHLPGGKDEIKYRFSLGKRSPDADTKIELTVGSNTDFYTGPTTFGYPDERIKAKYLIEEMGKKIPPKNSGSRP